MRISLRLHRLCAGLLLAWLFATAAHAFSIPSTEFTLANGLHVIVIEDHRSPVVTHAIGYRVGAADEATGKTGLAHLFEHLLFKGTTKYPYGTLERMVDDVGGERNAFTTSDVTVFYERLGKDSLASMMAVEADRMQNLLLTDDAFATEKKVVQEERRQQTDAQPTGPFTEKLDAALFGPHPYGRPVVGLPDDVARLTRADAEAFYRAHYTPANAIVLVVGDVDPAEVKRLAEATYGPLKNATPVPPRPLVPLTVSGTSPRLEAADARMSVTLLIRKFVAPAFGGSTPQQAAAFQVLANVLGGNTQSRLHKALVLGNRQASMVSAWYDGDVRQLGTFGYYAVPTPGSDVKILEASLNAVLQDVAASGITQAELERAQNTLLAAYIYQLDDPAGFGRMIGIGLANGLTPDRIYGREAALGAVTREDVQAAARSLLDGKTRNATGVITPQQPAVAQ